MRRRIMDDAVAFTIRIPASVADQIDRRAAVSRRSRNAEVLMLLEKAIDSSVDGIMEARALVERATAAS